MAERDRQPGKVGNRRVQHDGYAQDGYCKWRDWTGGDNPPIGNPREHWSNEITTHATAHEVAWTSSGEQPISDNVTSFVHNHGDQEHREYAGEGDECARFSDESESDKPYLAGGSHLHPGDIVANGVKRASRYSLR